MDPISPTPTRWFALDGLRGLAALVVVAAHYSIPGFAAGGFIGVDVFFVLSGFLITNVLLRDHAAHGSIRRGRFYARRARRLYPALLLLLVGAILYALIAPPDTAAEIWRGLAPAGFYYSNWWLAFGAPSIGPLEHTWTLAVEEQFYLLWPLILVLILRSRWRERATTVVGVLVVCIAVYRIVLLVATRNYQRTYYGFDTRADELLVGCALALAFQAGALPRLLPQQHRRWLTVTSSALLIAFIVVDFSFIRYKGAEGIAVVMPLGGYTVTALISATLIGALVLGTPGVLARVLEHRWLVFLGTISYGIYLWHYLIRIALPVDFSSPMAQALTTARDLALTLVVATASFYGIERRILRRRKPNPDSQLDGQEAAEALDPPSV